MLREAGTKEKTARKTQFWLRKQSTTNETSSSLRDSRPPCSCYSSRLFDETIQAAGRPARVRAARPPQRRAIAGNGIPAPRTPTPARELGRWLRRIRNAQKNRRRLKERLQPETRFHPFPPEHPAINLRPAPRPGASHWLAMDWVGGLNQPSGAFTF